MHCTYVKKETLLQKITGVMWWEMTPTRKNKQAEQPNKNESPQSDYAGILLIAVAINTENIVVCVCVQPGSNYHD